MSQSQFWHRVYAWLASNQMEAPLLLTGPPETDWQTLFAELRYAAVCTAQTDSACRTCRSCKQAAADNHPDSIVVEGEEKVIRVSHIRNLLETLSRTSLSSRRLIIIPQSERLRLEAANTLLKELEESSPANRFVLTTSYPKRLLATIRSRSDLMRIPAELVKKNAAAEQDPASAAKNIQTIADLGRKQPLTDEELETITRSIQTLLRRQGPTPALYRALLRLRDYYKIKGERGNEKLATDVLLASLNQLRNTK